MLLIGLLILSDCDLLVVVGIGLGLFACFCCGSSSLFALLARYGLFCYL